MAGRDQPGHHGSDTRWLVDRQVYEHRRDGMRYVTWSRATQLRLVWLVAFLVTVAGGLGAATVWAWQRFAPEIVAAMPATLRLSLAGWVEDQAGPLEAIRLHEIETARDLALRERDAARAPLAAMAVARDGNPTAPPAGEPVAAVAAGPDLELETTLLRHERDAAREQTDALMQLAAQLKAEIAATQAARPGVAETAAAEAAVVSADGAAQARITQLEAELASAREAGANVMSATLADRDRALASLGERDAAMRDLQASYDRLAARAADADEALSSRDRLLAETRQAALEENVAAQAALRAVHDDLDSRTETIRKLESKVAVLEAERKSVLVDLERIRAERDEAVQAERVGREERDTISARLQSLDSRRPADDADLLKAERDHLAARVSDLEAALDIAKSGGDSAAQELARVQGELAGASIEVGSLRAALEAARADLSQRDDLLAAVPALQARLVLAEARAAEHDRPVTPVTSEVVPAATWTVVEDGSMAEVDPALRAELATALARIKDLGGRVLDSERRAAELERYLADRAPLPPPAAPR